VICELRDELQRNRIVNEDLRDVLREVRDAIHHASAMAARMPPWMLAMVCAWYG
jgi:hypothetical protein